MLQNCGDEYLHELAGRAASEIERLRAALRDLLDASEQHIFSTECQKERDVARAALAEEKKDDR